jgi:hypothetical protein
MLSMPTTCDIRQLGVGRSMDLIMYVLYSGDERFVRHMVVSVMEEVAQQQQCPELMEVMTFADDRPQLTRCLFFLMLNFQARFRYWVLSEAAIQSGLQPICPHKAVRFLLVLRAELVPTFLMNETHRMDDFERALKVEYVRS